MPVRVSKLGDGIPAAGTSITLFTVAAGFTYLVKSVVVLNTGAAADTIGVSLTDAGGVQGSIIAQQSVVAGGRFEWNGLIAAAPGDVLKVFSTTGSSNFWVSGTKLPGVA